ncbi:urease accessory protein UreF [Sedimentitalea sp. HM32M-2]|uniref:urease accessory protein UreF n=1 Tax=Sedimentitalea sp. HM32M-2 TaxID=3351566 RepID=UPI003641B09B
MATPTDADVLTLSQWFSPAYPVGGFAYSHGLEWAIDSGAVTDAERAGNWVCDVLRHGAGWNDSLFLIAAYRAGSPAMVAKAEALCRATAASRERLQETCLQGQAFCRITSDIWGGGLHDLTYPVAVGRAARQLNLPLELTVQMYLQSFGANLAGAAMRLVPLGQTEGQAMIRDLAPLCRQIAGRALQSGLQDIGSTVFLADIAAMRHETQQSRIFRT